MAEYVRMPKEHYEAACNSIRAKTGKTDLITSGVMSTEIDGITGGGGGGSVEGYATVTFMNGADVLFSRLVMVGDDCPDPYVQGRIELPTKESTVDKVYTFNGWAATDGGSADSNALKGITEDKVLYAAFAESVRRYTVTYYDTDGVTVLHTEQVAYGTTPSYTPTKEGAMFGGWTPALAPVRNDTSYKVSSWITAIASGTCGDNATWLLDGNYALTISGTGEVVSSTMYPPWYDYISQIVKVVIDEGITSIENDSALFSQAKNVEQLYVPSTLTAARLPKATSIYAPSFSAWCRINIYGDTAIPFKDDNASTLYVNGVPVEGDVTIPADVTYVGNYAFARYQKITSLTIPATVESVGKGFCTSQYNGGITSVVFEGETTSIGQSAFTRCYKLTNVVLPKNITELPLYVFSNCSKLTSITIPASVTTIGITAFASSGLTSATFEDTEGWTAGTTAIASADLADPATAATYLKTTYKSVTWTKS